MTSRDDNILVRESHDIHVSVTQCHTLVSIDLGISYYLQTRRKQGPARHPDWPRRRLARRTFY